MSRNDEKHKSRHGLLRRLLLVLLFVVVLAVGAVVVIQAVLRSDVPKNRILPEVRRYLGVQVEAAQFQTQWGGQTVIKDLRVTLPADEKPSAVFDTVTVDHSSVPAFLVTQSLKIESLVFDGAVVELRQDRRGRWNLVQFINEFMALRRKDEDGGGRLPHVEINSGRLIVRGDRERTAVIEPVDFEGSPEGLYTWVFDANVPSRLEAVGRVGTTGSWEHRVDVEVADVNEVVGAIFGSVPGPVVLSAGWTGAFREGAARGLLNLRKLQVGGYRLAGDLSATLSSQRATGRPDAMTLSLNNDGWENIQVGGGSVEVSEQGFDITQTGLVIGWYAGYVSGSGGWSDSNSVWDSAWAYTDPEGGAILRGSLTAKLHAPKEGLKTLTAGGEVTGRCEAGSFGADFYTLAWGLDWRQSQLNLRISDPRWACGGRNISLKHIRAEAEISGSTAYLKSVEIAPAKVSRGSGYWSFAEPNWAVDLELWGVDAGPGGSVDLRIKGKGDANEIDISQAAFARGDLSASGSGSLTMPQGRLHDAQLSLKLPVGAPDVNEAVEGMAAAQLSARGNLWPVDVNIAGFVSADDLTVQQKPLPDANIPVRARVHEKEFGFETDFFQWLGGRFKATGGGNLPPDKVVVNISAQDVELDKAGRYLARDLGLEGEGSVDMQFTLGGEKNSPWTADGKWKLKNFKRGAFEATEGSGTFLVKDKLIRINEGRLQYGRGSMEGEMELTLDGTRLAEGNIKVNSWPLTISDPNLMAALNGNAHFELNLSELTGRADGDLSADLMLDGRRLAYARFDAEMDGNSVDLENVRLSALGGQARGRGHFLPDNWRKSTFDAEWENIKFSALETWWPGIEGLQGLSSGTIRLEPTDEPHPLEPLKLTIKSETVKGAYQTATIGDCSLVGYVGSDRIVLDRSEFDLIGGVVRVRGSRSLHEDRTSFHSLVDVNGISLSQLVCIADPNAEYMPGKISGKLTLMGADIRNLSGRGLLRLDEADLIESTVISTLYRLMDKRDMETAPGYGTIALHLAGKQLEIERFFYRSRSVEVRGAGMIKNFLLGPDSPVEGYAFGLDRPIKLPKFLGGNDFDQLMAVIQKNAASVEISGTLGNPVVEVIPLGQITANIESFFLSQFGGRQRNFPVNR